MENIVYDWIGGLHLIASIVALITGTLILAMAKGSEIHKKIGYIYVSAMLIVVATAFMIYRLFGGSGIFHWAAVVSGATLAGGMIPALLRTPDDWVILHFSFMYWSVLGLYAAFISEILVRVPESPFLEMVGFGTGGIMLVGGGWFYYRKDYWEAEFSN
ncbi:putative membrane protein (DUF2306) [Fodinibius salinus]|uniref:Putative membrane protein (DUF2306) n=1 Tax=Fodinibius salinus TaxID=860790 RepID=A0A5D3YHK9_9BACT|nr:DUF2306 domain-containing protein [Fodinibius salinus]TYP91739.1 putative membrane protein (DUF2306) [Fodinibius salinus]